MKAVTIYDQSTGDIKRTLFVPIGHEVKLSDGESSLEGQYDDDKFCIIDGEPRPKPPLEDVSAEGAVENANHVNEEYSAPTINDVRLMRNQMLAASDWTQLPDSPVDQAAWAEYRQELRDLPDITADPSNPVWPEPPE